MGRVMVIGASPNPERYSYHCVRALIRKKYSVVALGSRKGNIGNLEIVTDMIYHQDIDKVILYVNRDKQQKYLDYVRELRPSEIVFNPGAECPEMALMAVENNIEIHYDCALVMINTNRL